MAFRFFAFVLAFLNAIVLIPNVQHAVRYGDGFSWMLALVNFSCFCVCWWMAVRPGRSRWKTRVIRKSGR